MAVVNDTVKTVPVSCPRDGLVEGLRVVVAHAGGPVVRTGAGVTTCQVPVVGSNHSKLFPPPSSQSVIVMESNELPVDTATSKYWPVDEAGGVLTGFDPYWATVPPPTPTAAAVVPSLAAVAVPEDVVDVPLAELVEPVGGDGAVVVVVPPPPPATAVWLR